jgi:hypothetical protein
MRASLVATLCVAFIIFCSIGIRNHAMAFKEFVSAQIGSDLVVAVKPHFKITRSGLTNNANTVLPAEGLRKFLEIERIKGDLSEIATTAFITKPAGKSASRNPLGVESTYVTNFAWFPFTRPCDVIGVERNFLEASYSRFSLSGSLDSTAESAGVVEALYTDDLRQVHAQSSFMHHEGWTAPSVISGTNITEPSEIYANCLPASALAFSRATVRDGHPVLFEPGNLRCSKASVTVGPGLHA